MAAQAELYQLAYTPPLPAYTTEPSASSPSDPQSHSPNNMKSSSGPNAPDGEQVVRPNQGYAPEGKGGMAETGPVVVYQPVPTGQQPAVAVYSSGGPVYTVEGPQLPVTPHPAIALALGLIAVLCFCCCVCGIPAIILGSIVLAKHPREVAQQKSAITMSKIGLALGIAGVVCGAVGYVVYFVAQLLGRNASNKSKYQ